MQTVAVVLEQPEQLSLRALDLVAAAESDIVVDVAWSGISTGTERLLWSGRMPSFPGMGYPLVPGYESVGRVVAAGAQSGRQVDDLVFVPGSRGFDGVRGLFGGAASRLVVDGKRAVPLAQDSGPESILIALAATAHHALRFGAPDLIVGHGVLGRLLARLCLAEGVTPTVWEARADRRADDLRYPVIDPANDPRRDYRIIVDVSGDATLLDALIARLAPGGQVTLAGFYAAPLSFSFPPAFMREARLQVAAEWKPADLEAIRAMLEAGTLSLDGLITHREPAANAASAYRTAFDDPDCLKMVLDWSSLS